MSSPVVFFQITTIDAESTKTFLGQLFGWTFGEGTPGVYAASIDPDGPGDFDVKGALMEIPAERAAGVNLFVRVENLEAAWERAKDLGATQLVAPTRTATGADIAIIRSPEGLVFGIVQA